MNINNHEVHFFLGDEAKKQWKYLRDGYRSALKMYKSNKTDPSKRVKTWKYFEQMNFLRPYMRDRQRNNNINAEYSEDTEIFDESSQEHRYAGTIKEEITEFFEAPNLIDEENEDCFQDDSTIPSKKLCLIAKSKNDQLEDISKELRWSQSEFGHTPEDSLKLFFDSMYASTKKLSPALQRVVKNKLFQAVNEAEEEMEQTCQTN